MESNFKKFGFSNLITSYPGLRGQNAKHSHSNTLKTIFYIYAAGDKSLDDVKILQEHLNGHPDIAICSADTIEYVCQELKQVNQSLITDNYVTHTINDHAGFNQSLSLLCKSGCLLNTSDTYTMDYDGHIVENTKQDNARNYKKTEGYYPIIGSSNQFPVYMKSRNSNTPENYNQLAIIQQALRTAKHKKQYLKNSGLMLPVMKRKQWNTLSQEPNL